MKTIISKKNILPIPARFNIFMTFMYPAKEEKNLKHSHFNKFNYFNVLTWTKNIKKSISFSPIFLGISFLFDQKENRENNKIKVALWKRKVFLFFSYQKFIFVFIGGTIKTIYSDEINFYCDRNSARCRYLIYFE